MSFRFNQGDRPLPGYTIQRGVGRGGFGEVYYAVSDGGKEVALKYLRENPQVELRGATHCLNLKSPYLVGIQDIKQSVDGEFFVIMEFVNGSSLRDLLNEEPRGLGAQKAAYFVREIGKGLSYLHDRGIVHRDLKPGNIFYEDGYVKIGDYGLSKMMAASQHSGQTMSVGTVHYMAPEVGSGNYDRTIDIYALGVMLYEMLLGRVPFSGASMGEVLMKHLTASPEVDELPEPFPRVIRKALAKDPRDRYQTVNEMISDLFAVDELSQSVSSMDSLNLTRMAAAVARKVKVGEAVGVGRGRGSSHVPPLGSGVPVVPPPPVEESRRRRRRNRIKGVEKNPMDAWAGRNSGVDDGITDEPTFPQRSRVTTGLLGIFLGWFGIHRFYTGHYAIGVYQILVTSFTGVGALWGIIEGVVILMNTDFQDAAGRPLLERGRYDPTHRNVVIRVFWGLIGVVQAKLAIGLAIAGSVADAEYAYFSTSAGEIHFNKFHWLWVGACYAAGVSAFGLWKAAHRGGFGIWRATIRPVLMALTGASAMAALVVEGRIAPFAAQFPLIVLAGAMGVAFLIFWILRGNGLILRPEDGYWNRTLMRLFIFFGVAVVGCAALVWFSWHKEKYVWHNPDVSPQTVQVDDREMPYERQRSRSTVREEEPRTIRVASSAYDIRPVALGFAAILFAGCMFEADFRRRTAAKVLASLG
ncbi:MAG: protein kinase [Planctomycetes bacterium]|nr:protein kinase [Planctomycetota bacterium]